MDIPAAILGCGLVVEGPLENLFLLVIGPVEGLSSADVWVTRNKKFLNENGHGGPIAAHMGNLLPPDLRGCIAL